MTAQSQHLRVAIAISVLRHKPPEQSLSSYLIDLKQLFPSTVSSQTTVNSLQENSSTASSNDPASQATSSLRPGDETDPWRKQVLTLEKENEELRLRAQKYEQEALALKSIETSCKAENNADSTSQSSKRKKKSGKVETKVAPDKLDLKTLIKGIRTGRDLPALKDSLDILTSFRIVQQAASNNLLHPNASQETVLIPNIRRSLVASGNLLAALLSKNGSVIAKSERSDIPNCLRNLLVTLLESTLPLGPRHSILPQITGDLTVSVIRPLIRGFHQLSVHEFASLKDKNHKNVTIDIRPDLLQLLQHLLECLRNLKERTREIREFIVLEAAIEISSLWKTVIDAKSSECTSEDRVDRLARKDSLWYHCSILHLALDELPSPKINERDEVSILTSMAFESLADLPHRFDKQRPADEVAKGMVLAVIEKAWLSGLYVAKK